MNPIRWIASRLEHVMFDLSTHHPLQLSAYRVFFAAYMLVSNQVPSVRWVADLPSDMRNPPPGLTSIVPHPTPAMAVIVEVAMLLALVGLLLGWRTRFMSVAVGVIGMVGSAMAFSFGKIDHSIFLWLIALAMATTAWGDRLSLDGRGQPSQDSAVATPAVPFLSVLLALAFLTAAVPKFAGNWLSTDASATRSYFVDRARRGETNFSTSFLLDLDSTFLWEGADWATLGLEFGFAAFVLWPFAYRLIAGVAALFHLTVLFVLNINFESSLVLYVGFLLQGIDVDQLEHRLRSLAEHRNAVIFAGSAFVAAACIGQFAGPGLLRILLGSVGVSVWGVSLITQLGFFVLLQWLVWRSIRRHVTSSPTDSTALVKNF